MTTAFANPVRACLAKERAVIATAAVTLAAAWWAMATHTHHEPGAGTNMLFATATWMVMMLAMMLPVVTPWLTTFASLNRGRNGSSPLVSTGTFATGYFAAWASFSVVAAFLQATFGESTVPSVWGAIALVGAGLFQFSRLKTTCLDHCRSPLGYLLTHWGDGPRWAFGLGLRHGLYCLGCCWALMGLSFVLGLMNLAWMAAVTLMLCVEVVAPRGKYWSHFFGVVLVCWGLSLLAVR